MQAKCYMCNKPGITREHVPPKCLFPEGKDLENGDVFRRNLITVPSCEKHNSAKSKDDEYLLFFLASNILTNNYGEEHFSKKIMRAVNRNPHVFNEFVKNNQRVILVNRASGEQKQSMSFKIDRARFDSATSHIAYGIYYDEYGEKFRGEIDIFTEGLMDTNGSNSPAINENIQNMGKDIEAQFRNISPKGNNQEIFYYQVKNEYKVLNGKYAKAHTLIRLCFYGHFKISALMKHIHV